MNNDVERSHLGGESSIKGFKYQKDFIALLCAKMICKQQKINKIICEYKNDIEVFEDKKLTSWQIKSTTRNTLETKKVYESINLFYLLNNADNYSKFIIVSNRNFTGLNMQMLAYYDMDNFPDLKSKIQREFGGELGNNFLSKVKFMRGPEPETIRSIISDELSCLHNKKSLSQGIISFIDNIWIGLRDIVDFRIQDIKQRKKEDIEFKTITVERIKNEILSKNGKNDNATSFEFEFPSEIKSSFSEKIKDVDKYEINYLIETYRHDSYFQDNVLINFEKKSTDTKLYKNTRFMGFLKSISNNEDKHKVLIFFCILHNLLRTSKIHDKEIYAKIVNDYRRLLYIGFSNWDERYRYSYNKIKDTIYSLDLTNEEWCKLHWDRIKNAIIADITEKEIEKIYENITFLQNNNCKSLNKYRKYLKEQDNHTGVKRTIESLLIRG
jgi:Cap4-like dsDNA endonuclease family protein